jgi:hypothetical protein
MKLTEQVIIADWLFMTCNAEMGGSASVLVNENGPGKNNNE